MSGRCGYMDPIPPALPGRLLPWLGGGLMSAPAAASLPGQEPVCACGDPAGSPEHHSSDADGGHNFSPVRGQEGKP